MRANSPVFGVGSGAGSAGVAVLPAAEAAAWEEVSDSDASEPVSEGCDAAADAGS